MNTDNNNTMHKDNHEHHCTCQKGGACTCGKDHCDCESGASCSNEEGCECCE